MIAGIKLPEIMLFSITPVSILRYIDERIRIVPSFFCFIDKHIQCGIRHFGRSWENPEVPVGRASDKRILVWGIVQFKHIIIGEKKQKKGDF